MESIPKGTAGELQGGKADGKFAYRVLAKRKDIAGARLEKVTGPDAARLAEMAKKEPPAPKAREPKKHLGLANLEAPTLTEVPAGQRPGPQLR